MAGLERWKGRHPEAAAHLEPADALADRMRGSASLWTWIRVEHVRARLPPTQEALDPDSSGWQARTRHNIGMSTPRLKSIEHSTLWDRAYEALKSALLAGRFAPGERVVLRRVADDLGISLTPVRDAVNRLIAEKVLMRGGLGPAGAALVPLLDEDQFNQLMIVRASLEPIAAAAAALHATPERIDAVEAFLVEMKRSVRENRTEQYLDAHYKFHFGIYAMCAMPVVEEIIESAWLRCAPALTLALPENIPSLKRYSAHVATIAALRKGDGEAAALAIRGDIESAREDIGAMLRERERVRGK